ncbi:MAG: AraC family transcriptional regulator [Comamonadaceae bacterium]|nr:AraC family transcriptional regulator [Comamonadaceae bacterium]
MDKLANHSPPHQPAPPGEGFSVAVHFFQLLADYTERKGLAMPVLLARAGLPTSAARGDANGRVPFDVFRALCDAAAELLCDPSLGLHLGASIRPGHLGSHGYALMNCTDALDLARQSARYSALTIDACCNVIEQRGDEFVRTIHSNLPGNAPLGRICEDLQHAIAITFGRWITNREDATPLWASFRYPQPDDLAEYEALFRCPLRFGEDTQAIAFDARIASLPLPHADPQVRRMMEDLCAKLMQQLASAFEPAWLELARRATLDAFRSGGPEPNRIAAAIGVTPDDFKALLAQHDLSFRSFVDDLRQAMALSYIRDTRLSLVDIAFLLGFSEQSAFQRAFKRWTGETPGQWRRGAALPSHSMEGA